MTLIWVVCLCAVSACAQTVFPFSVDQDAVSGPVDFSYLNSALTEGDRVFIRDGHFHRVGPDRNPGTDDDNRLRFFGVNLAFSANFPSETDSRRIAKRLRRLGVNLVRLHHLDTQPDRDPSNAGSTLTTGPYPTLNPVAIARLRTFLNALREEGIYINLNLHVGYKFRPATDNIPSISPFPDQSKPVRAIHTRLIELQGEYTRKLIEALELRDDPVLAMVEISNESSLVYHWQANSLDRSLQGEYRDALYQRWNDWLSARYNSTGEIRSAWGGSERDSEELLPGNWVIENQPHVTIQSSREPGEYHVHAPAANLPVIAKQVGFSVETPRTYLAEIEIRADLPDGASRTIYWDVKQDVSPWRTVAGQNITVTNQWQTFRMVVTPQFAMDKIGRFGLSIERVGAPLSFRNWRLYAPGRRGLSEGETIEDRSISLPAGNDIGTDARTNDYLLFLANQDKDYLNAMLTAVRETTDSLVPVAGTQMGYGGLLNLDSHDDLGYQDNHYYVDHYNFPNVSWDGRDWRIRDQSSVGSGAAPFTAMAATRQAGRPYTVSEFNQPWPNTYAAECDPTLAVFARFQDWDGIMHFAYSHGRRWDDGVPNGFDINGDWTKWAGLGQSAWLFRSRAIQVGIEPIRIPVSRDMRLRATRERRNGSVAAFLTSGIGYDPNTAFVHPIELVKDGEGDAPEAAREKQEPPYRADSGEFTYDPQTHIWRIHARSAAGVIGFAGRSPVESGHIGVELAPSARGFVSLLATALDGHSLDRSARILISNPGYTLRTQPGASAARPQQIVNYGSTTDWWTLEPEPGTKPSGNLNGGIGPTYMERIECFLTLRTEAKQIAVYPLDGSGQRQSPLSGSDVERTESGVRIHLQADGQYLTPWYEIEAAF